MAFTEATAQHAILPGSATKQVRTITVTRQGAGIALSLIFGLGVAIGLQGGTKPASATPQIGTATSIVAPPKAPGQS